MDTQNLRSADRLAALRAVAADWGREFRAARADAYEPPEPGRVAELAAATVMATAGAPTEYAAPRLRIAGRGQPLDSAVERVVVMEELARGDLDTFMTCPGPSMSGVLIEALGDRALRDRFWGRLARRTTWTFFALTEPGHGSAAVDLTTSGVPLRAPGQPTRPAHLVGEKCWVGGVARAELGVVFARTGHGPLAIDAFLLETDRPGFAVRPLATLGVRGAQLCAITLDGVPVHPRDVVGAQLPAARRGLRGSLTVLHRLRPGVAALALGVALASIETAEAARTAGPVRRRLAELRAEAAGLREVIRYAAETVDATGQGEACSVAKASACRFALATTREVAGLLGARGLLEHPIAHRAWLDARGVALMEGTETVQLLAAFQGVNSGRELSTGLPLEPVNDESATGQAPIRADPHAGTTAGIAVG